MKFAGRSCNGTQTLANVVKAGSNVEGHSQKIAEAHPILYKYRKTTGGDNYPRPWFYGVPGIIHRTYIRPNGLRI